MLGTIGQMTDKVQREVAIEFDEAAAEVAEATSRERVEQPQERRKRRKKRLTQPWLRMSIRPRIKSVAHLLDLIL